MAGGMPEMMLRHAPRDEGHSRFTEFINGINDSNVRLRSEEVITAAIKEQNLFFLEDAHGHLIGTTGFYHHGSDDDLWGEIGSSLIHPAYRGFQLQVIIYQYVIALEWLAYHPLGPVMAVVDESAVGSYENIERCHFLRSFIIPASLQRAKRGQDWSKIKLNEKRLYLLTKESIAQSLLFVASNGTNCIIKNKETSLRYQLSIEFTFIKQSSPEELQIEADEVLKSGYGNLDT